VTRVSREIVVHAPPEEVFRHLVEPAERAKWQTSFGEAPLDAPMKVGTRIRATRHGSTSGSRYEFVVTALDPPRHLAMDAYRNGQHVAVGSFHLARDGDATRVRDEAEAKLSGLQRMLAPMVNAELEKRMQHELAALKRHVESSRK
jgi:uncharacterized protein YndB with AHSA1/START domain